ncbi:hypothetical protein [Sorangium cellulosum]
MISTAVLDSMSIEIGPFPSRNMSAIVDTPSTAPVSLGLAGSTNTSGPA